MSGKAIGAQQQSQRRHTLATTSPAIRIGVQSLTALSLPVGSSSEQVLYPEQGTLPLAASFPCWRLRVVYQTPTLGVSPMLVSHHKLLPFNGYTYQF